MKTNAILFLVVCVMYQGCAGDEGNEVSGDKLEEDDDLSAMHTRCVRPWWKGLVAIFPGIPHWFTLRPGPCGGQSTARYECCCKPTYFCPTWSVNCPNTWGSWTMQTAINPAACARCHGGKMQTYLYYLQPFSRQKLDCYCCLQ